ncbi:MAG: dihydropteroate synthase [Saprospiraceae bacterium]|nr:dihydropteroate synthase [Saprospiraceae bacterium]
MLLNCRGRFLDLSSPVVMGILNITPDSFYVSSRLKSHNNVLQCAEKMLNEGAIILDIGGVSSRPNANNVSVNDELKRVLPVIQLVAKHFPEAFISVDTYNSEVAKQAIHAGAHIINDISASSIDEKMIDVVASERVPYILMHMQGTPQIMQKNPNYKNVVVDIMDFFINKIATLKSKGIQNIILDVGFGFGKTIEHNYQLLKNLHVYKTLEVPIMVGVSRKSMIWKVLDTTPEGALNGTTALNMLALQQGTKILRVHDVKSAVEVIKLWQILDEQ